MVASAHWLWSEPFNLALPSRYKPEARRPSLDQAGANRIQIVRVWRVVSHASARGLWFARVFDLALAILLAMDFWIDPEQAAHRGRGMINLTAKVRV
eukprot:1151594-Pelagomonas_calceolata.AAC.1